MTTATAMTTQEIQAKLSELKAKRAEIDNRLAELSKNQALAMVAGEDMNVYEANRLKVAEESRHLGELIATLESSVGAAAKNAEIQNLEKAFADRKSNNLLERAAKQRFEAARRELNEAETAVKEHERLWYHYGELIGHYKTKLKKEHGLTDIELNQIEAKFKNE